MQPASPRIVELLNDALTFELTVTNTYFLHARMLDNWGLPKLGKVFYELSIDEMRDADDLINRILLFDGHPNVQRLNPIQVGESPEEMLRLALASELAAVAQFNAYGVLRPKRLLLTKSALELLRKPAPKEAAVG